MPQLARRQPSPSGGLGTARFLAPQLVYLRHVLANSFWFVPALMTIAGAALAAVSESTTNTSWLASNLVAIGLLPADSDTSRLILSTIVGSIITVTMLFFSMTLIVLSLGPFVATFVHALLTLTMSADPVPVVSAFGSVVLVLICFGLLIYFIHHMVRSMEADHIPALVNDDITRAIARSFPEPDDVQVPEASRGEIADVESGDRTIVRAPATGYIQTVGYDRLLELAVAADVVIQLDRRAGHFVIAGAPMGAALPAPFDEEEQERLICRTIVVGHTRTAAQDVEFSIKSMVEVALRALSPGWAAPWPWR
jgi:uncharacterized membrane protein